MQKTKSRGWCIALLLLLSVLFLAPIFIVFMNSFKGKFYISAEPFRFPNAETFAGLTNYTEGLRKTDFASAFGRSLFITIFSVLLLALFTAMTAWYLWRIQNGFTKAIYAALIFSMIVPFQMVMFTLSKTADLLSLNNPIGIPFIYLGFGAGLSTFLYSGFIRTLPPQLEEAATIDGCGPVGVFFRIIFPLLKPTAVTVSILNAMWIWNDYLLPYLLLGTDYPTIPIAVQYLKGGYGSVDMGAMMAMLVLAILPIVLFYLIGQKYIIRGVIAGAVKG